MEVDPNLSRILHSETDNEEPEEPNHMDIVDGLMNPNLSTNSFNRLVTSSLQMEDLQSSLEEIAAGGEQQPSTSASSRDRKALQREEIKGKTDSKQVRKNLNKENFRKIGGGVNTKNLKLVRGTKKK